MPYAICKECNITTNVGSAQDAPVCQHCGQMTVWLVPPEPSSTVDESATLVEKERRPGPQDHVSPTALGVTQTAKLASQKSDSHPSSNPPTVRLTGEASPKPSSIPETASLDGSGLFPRQTPAHMSIPFLAPPVQQDEFNPTRPKTRPQSNGPSGRTIGILILVAALTGVALALLSP